MQRYDIRDPDSRFVKRFWRTVNTPIIKEGRLVYLLHQVEDITAQFSARDHIFIDDESESLISVAFEKSWRFVDLRTIPKHFYAIGCEFIWSYV